MSFHQCIALSATWINTKRVQPWLRRKSEPQHVPTHTPVLQNSSTQNEMTNAFRRYKEIRSMPFPKIPSISDVYRRSMRCK